ncbi:hypothetical protein [Nocardia wallacei]|uniref:hypothetical protein n=1 Tax=Nocardia wallacei TaxID=480035 RepID=UPI0024545978|nr:hypothetical protein [Nocardia wallacei]
MNAAGWSAIMAVFVIMGGVMWLALRSDRVYAREASEAPTRVFHVVTGWNHEAPRHPLTVRGAHLEMQRHRICQREDCPRKRAAYQTLVEAGRLMPDSGRIH